MESKQRGGGSEVEERGNSGREIKRGVEGKKRKTSKKRCYIGERVSERGSEVESGEMNGREN